MIRRLKARSGTTRQMVVLCHGVGSNGDDLIALAPHWAAFAPDADFISPDAPDAYDMAPTGRQWFSLQDRSGPAMERGARKATTWLLDFMEAELSQLGLPAEACAMMGFSQGAMLCLFAGLRRPTPPAVILAYSGGLIAPERLAAERQGAPPVLLVHGTEDQVVPAAWSADTAALLEQQGVPVHLLLCPGLQHGIDEAGILAGAQELRKAFF